MIYPGFCGSANASQSPLADGEDLVNWYEEHIESPYAPTNVGLYPTPGQQNFVQTTDVGTRGGFQMNGRAFTVVGTGFYEVFATNTYILRGSVAQDNYPATISGNGLTGGQLFITSGGNGYCYVLATNVLTTVLTGEATQGGMLNARFLAFNIVNGKVRMSALNDGTTWDPTLFFQRTIAPDPWQCMLIGTREIWLIGEQTGEVWYDTGAFPQPFAPIPGAVFQWGVAAPFAATTAGDAMCWLSKTVNGAGVVVRATGYSPQAISTAAVDTAIGNYARTSTIADAEAFSYQEDGHLFTVFSFPTANATHVVDQDSGRWHKRGTWNSALNQYDVWHPRVSLYAFGKHLVGERGTGMISEMSILLGSEAGGGPIRRRRIPPPLWAATKQRLTVSRLELMVDSGLGLSSGQGSNPQMMLRTSEDSRTWGNERLAGAGPMGNYGTHVYWTRCGSSTRVWVPEITVSDPIPWRIVGAQIDGVGILKLPKAA